MTNNDINTNEVTITTLRNLIVKYDAERIDPTDDITAIKHLLTVDLYITALANSLQNAKYPLSTLEDFIILPINSTGIENMNSFNPGEKDDDPAIKNALRKVHDDIVILNHKNFIEHSDSTLEYADFAALLDNFGETAANAALGKINNDYGSIVTYSCTHDGLLQVTVE